MVGSSVHDGCAVSVERRPGRGGAIELAAEVHLGAGVEGLPRSEALRLLNVAALPDNAGVPIAIALLTELHDGGISRARQ